MFSADFLGSGSFANELYVYNIDRTVQGATVSYADSRFSGKAGFQSNLSSRRTEWTDYSLGFGRIEDSRVEEASVVFHSLSDREGFGGLDHTMGEQGAKRTVDGDVGADSGEAGGGTGDRYGTSPSKGKNTGYES